MRLFFLRRKIRGRQTNNSCFSANTEVRPAWSDVESFAAALPPLQNLVSLPVPFWQEPECTFFSFECVCGLKIFFVNSKSSYVKFGDLGNTVRSTLE